MTTLRVARVGGAKSGSSPRHHATIAWEAVAELRFDEQRKARSGTLQCSAGLPFSNRHMSITLMLIGLPDRGSVPVHLLRAQNVVAVLDKVFNSQSESYVAAYGVDLILRNLGPGNIGPGEVFVLRQLCCTYFIGNGQVSRVESRGQ